ncbi:MAG: hypothetical protein ACRDE8_14050 [Ginsengibacter sp.]
MAKNTGMNGEDDKAGKTAGLSATQAKKVNKMLADEQKETAPTKTMASINKVREKRKNERGPEDKIFKSH